MFKHYDQFAESLAAGAAAKRRTPIDPFSESADIETLLKRETGAESEIEDSQDSPEHLALKEVLSQLPEREISVVRLLMVSGRTVAEVASQLDMTVGEIQGVKSRVITAVKARMLANQADTANPMVCILCEHHKVNDSEAKLRDVIVNATSWAQVRSYFKIKHDLVLPSSAFAYHAIHHLNLTIKPVGTAKRSLRHLPHTIERKQVHLMIDPDLFDDLANLVSTYGLNLTDVMRRALRVGVPIVAQLQVVEHQTMSSLCEDLRKAFDSTEGKKDQS